MNLFDYEANKKIESESPLAARMRPKTLDDFIGQANIVGEGTLLNRAIKADKVGSIILFGPPGSGKTTLARIIAASTSRQFVSINAVSAGIKEIKESVQNAKYALAVSGTKTILFIDEIHRFNKSQQDALLPYVEDGTLSLIGATTENPFFEVNKPLISRSTVFELLPLDKDDIKNILLRAIKDKENGLGVYNVKIDNDALLFISDISNGDARIALNSLELATLSTEPDENGHIVINLKTAEECIQKRAVKYDKNGESHYDTISAFIKSMRGSDPDATVYYLARMLYAGEDPVFIARRIIICASEDVGMADPNALNIAVSALQATMAIGMPEARIVLSHAAIYVACAPKSNSAYLAIDSALADVRNIKIKRIPHHLCNAPVSGMKELGRSIGYKYAHDYPNHYTDQQYLPDELVNKKYFNPDGIGFEAYVLSNFDNIGKNH